MGSRISRIYRWLDLGGDRNRSLKGNSWAFYINWVDGSIIYLDKEGVHLEEEMSSSIVVDLS